MEQPSTIIKSVILGFEGLLALTDDLDTQAVKTAIGCSSDVFLRDFIARIKNTERRKQLLSDVEPLQMKAAANTKPAAGAEALIQYFRSKRLQLGLVSEKSLAGVQRALQKFKSITVDDFEVIVTSDDLFRYKTLGRCLAQTVKKLHLKAAEVLVVSASEADMRAGTAAGAVTVFLNKRQSAERAHVPCHHVISDIDALKKIVRMRIPLPAGKLPNDLLREFLDDFIFEDPALLINPGIGEDIAAVDVSAEQVLVLKSDPITFATDAIGQYAVLINANDIATSGAIPRWLLTTLLFPCGVTAYQIQRVVEELREFCRQWRITLCGGHTEITDAVSRPVVAGMMAGTVARSDLIDKRNMAAGDKVLLTKRVAVEGTAIIAREFGQQLRKMGMLDSEINTCRRFLSYISIIPEARIAAQFEETSAMHDITEGGLATALKEFSLAGGHRIRIDTDTIPLFAETKKICRLFDIDPLGLIGSGSLLICCRATGLQNLMAAIRAGGIEIACIGEVLAPGHGIEARKNHQPIAWPCFEVDEITKLF